MRENYTGESRSSFAKVVLKSIGVLALALLSTAGFSQTFTIGTGTTSNTTTTYPAPYGNWYWGSRAQYIYRASELSAVGAAAGVINSIAFNVTNTNGSPGLNGFTIYMKNSTTNDLSSAWESGMTQVYSSTSYTPVNGWNTHLLSTAFNWDGTSNLIVEVCFNNSSFTNNASTQWTTGLPSGTSRTYRTDATGVCGNTGNSNQNPTNRPNAQFDISSAPCVAPPTAGTVSGPTSICANDMLNLTLSGATTGTGLTYQWQTSSDNINWTNATGATNASYSSNQSADTYYRCIITCSGQSDTTASYMVTMNPFTACYCVPVHQYGCVTYGQTNNVSIPGTSLNNPSGCGTNSYTQYAPGAGTTALMLKGNTYDIDVTVGGGSTSYGSVVYAWLDLNQNGTFESTEAIAINNGNTVGHSQTGTGTITIPTTALSGPTGLRIRSEWEIYTMSSSESCTQKNYGETEDYVVTILPPPANDAGITSIDTPLVSACAVSNSLWVSLSNLGTDTLSSATLNWSVNGNLQTPVSWSGTVDPLSSSAMPQFVGNFSFAVGDSIAVWTTSPNGVVDSLTQNDTMIFIVPALSLNGTYTIDPLGSGTNNYTNFTSAISDLNQVGVCGPVVFEIADNVYTNEQLLFGNILGASATNSITFMSASGDTSACIVEYTSQGTTNLTYDGVVRFDAGASNVHFENIQFVNPATSSTYANVVTFNGASSNITFTGCRLVNYQASTTSNYAALVYKNGPRVDSVMFDGCSFINGSYGAYFYGNSSDYDEMNTFKNSEFLNNYYAGVWFYYQSNPKVDGCTFTSPNSSYGYGYGIRVYYATGEDISVSENHIYQSGNTWPAYGMYFYGWTGDFNKFAKINGNGMSMPNGGTYGVYLGTMLFTEFSNNSIYFEDTNINDEGVYVTGGSLNRWYNNAFQAGGQARAAYIGTPGAIYESDNNAWSGENNFVYWSGDQADLTSLQNASGNEATSVQLSNIFSDTMRLMTCNDTLDGTGLSNPGYMMDIHGDPVDTSAIDIGADQFATPASFNLRDTVGLCALGDTTTLEAWYYDSISWNNGMASGNYYDVTSQGVVVVEAHGICGVAYDTVTVAIATPVDLPATSIVCTGGTGTIDAGIANGSYMWSNGQTTQSITVASAGTYEVTVTDIDGCVSDDQTLAEFSVPVDLAEQEAMCDGNPVTIDAGIANGTYTWTNGDATQTTTVSTAGIYGVTVTDADGCTSEDMTEVVMASSPVADFTSLSSFYAVQFTNNSQFGTSYYWEFGDGNTSTEENPTHLYNFTNDSSITYSVMLVVENLCGTDTISFEVEVGSAVGVEELANGVSYEVYPNPNAGQFNVVLTNAGNKEVSYVLVDVQGKVVVQRNVGTVSNSHQEQIDVTGVASGIYFLRMNIGNETTVERVAIR